ncbi:MAG TPA: hypothetical protein VFL62_11740 [Bradyrhizobium sp.]|uniref:hypothetical protein n=1 Tax=Bradyrhizobium sp. TaxID=376 RepID=UPI002D801096|nr:hypothetical protein [Bradyrhizobium sp.]HET7886889.1 hypothetical protein [Bradyrhizobium sp.]
MLSDAQVAVLCDIAQSVALADDRQRELEQLAREGYIARDGERFAVTPKGQQVLSDRGAGLNEA